MCTHFLLNRMSTVWRSCGWLSRWSDAGRKVAKRYGVHVADAIDPTSVGHIKPLVSKKLPQLLKLVSAERRAELQRQDPVG